MEQRYRTGTAQSISTPTSSCGSCGGTRLSTPCGTAPDVHIFERCRRRSIRTMAKSFDTFVALPDPGRARTLDELTECLRSLKSRAGSPSYEVITSRIKLGLGEGRTSGGRTGPERAGRRLLQVRSAQDRHRIGGRRRAGVAPGLRLRRAVATGNARGRRRNHRGGAGPGPDGLPRDLVEFTGRTAELARIRAARVRAGAAPTARPPLPRSPDRRPGDPPPHARRRPRRRRPGRASARADRTRRRPRALGPLRRGRRRLPGGTAAVPATGDPICRARAHIDLGVITPRATSARRAAR